ncbi:Hypothetical predicted protein [Marmota monax]|uniref:Uncharacterized protein n=1 Tax=Marmota monax TaxID=9995 RepID=A0A5E4ATS9_MARMO|nr:hypothetical protein GHT09_017717 [Marmota monax]VTJ59942.1 Hypothetical predicted protein [Marmota monax]
MELLKSEEHLLMKLTCVLVEPRMDETPAQWSEKIDLLRLLCVQGSQLVGDILLNRFLCLLQLQRRREGEEMMEEKFDFRE